MSYPGIAEAVNFVMLCRSMLFSFLRKAEESRKNISKYALKRLIFQSNSHTFLSMISICTIWHDGCFYFRG